MLCYAYVVLVKSKRAPRLVSSSSAEDCGDSDQNIEICLEDSSNEPSIFLIKFLIIFYLLCIIYAFNFR